MAGEPYYNPPMASTEPGGPTLRDEFAGRVLAGIDTIHLVEGVAGWTPQHIANHAYTLADAMLRERAVER